MPYVTGDVILSVEQAELFQFFPSQRILVEVFDLGPGPGCFSQEFEAGLDGRIAGKAVDADVFRQLFPAVAFHQVGDDFFEGQAVKGIVRLFGGGGLPCGLRRQGLWCDGLLGGLGWQGLLR